jgi:hypothetical protein
MPETDFNQIKELLEKNLTETAEVKEEISHIRRYLRLRLIFNAVWIIIVLAPAVFAIFYIPSLIKDLVGDGDIFKLLGI